MGAVCGSCAAQPQLPPGMDSSVPGPSTAQLPAPPRAMFLQPCHCLYSTHTSQFLLPAYAWGELSSTEIRGSHGGAGGRGEDMRGKQHQSLALLPSCISPLPFLPRFWCCFSPLYLPSCPVPMLITPTFKHGASPQASATELGQEPELHMAERYPPLLVSSPHHSLEPRPYPCGPCQPGVGTQGSLELLLATTGE